MTLLSQKNTSQVWLKKSCKIKSKGLGKNIITVGLFRGAAD